MRKSYVKILTFGAAVALCAMASNADAKVTGRCDNCHTMHNSQNGTNWPGNTTTPNDSLTTGTCVGCHTGTGSSKLAPTTLAPAVVTTATPASQSTFLPGGFITLAAGNLDSWNHNVLGADVQDVAIGGNIQFAPPGYDATLGSSIGLPANNGAWTQLTCAGNMGCHGDHTKTNQTLAIAGGHHDDTAVGFRLLTGIHGVEGTTYSVGAGEGGTQTSSNVYDGINGNTNYANKTTISYLCAECHGIFHKNPSETGSATPWLRHPTDFQLPADRPDAYTSYGTAGRPYDADAPVGMNLGSVTRLSGGGTAPLPAAGQGSVLCISCHRAHGSDQPDLLRWTYADMNAGQAGGAADTGCFLCHTNKD